MMKELVADEKLVAYCGLYCGACRSYLKETCPGCAKNESAGWCEIRKCCQKNGFSSCADCREFPDPKDCGKFHNLISRIIGFFLRSDRRACVLQIRDKGLSGHAEEMARRKRHSLPR